MNVSIQTAVDRGARTGDVVRGSAVVVVVFIVALVLAWAPGGTGVAHAQMVPRTEPDRIPEREPAPPATPSRSTLPLADDESRARARFTSPDLLDASIDADSYLLGAGDILSITIQIGEIRTELLPVLPEGVVVPPQIGPVQAAGRTLNEFRAALVTAVRKRYRDFDLYCYLARPRQFRIWITGEVRDPGMVAARAVERVSDVIDRAGGLTANASRRDIELCDADGTVRERVDLAAFLVRGDASANPRVSDGQIVRVPARRRSVYIDGAVAVPGRYEPGRDESLRDLLAFAGGPLPAADLTRVSVERTNPRGAVDITVHDLARDDVASAEDVTRVSVLSSELGRRRVFVIGPNGDRSTYALEDGETVAQLARRVATFGPNADPRAAQLSTRDSNGENIRVPVDIVGALDGEGDRVLQDGDILSVPEVRDYVYVSGHVTRPGRYVYRGDWSAADYVGEAGGPTSAGSRDRVVVLDTDGEKRKGDRQARVERGETVYLERSTAGQATTALGILANLSALIISVVALSR